MKTDFWYRFLQNRLAVAGSAIVVLLFVVSLLAPWIAPFDPTAIDLKNILQPPSATHWFGTDQLGRDVMSRMIWGSQISLKVGFVSTGIAILIGAILGSVAGYYGRWVDAVIMRFVDIMLCFPTFFLILAVIAFLEPSIWNIMIIIGVTGWMGITRLVRADFISLKERDFVQAARVIGASDARIIFIHVLPNCMASVLVAATLGVAGAILTESALSFLGIGVQPPTPSWGMDLSESRQFLQIAYWTVLFPGLAIFIVSLAPLALILVLTLMAADWVIAGQAAQTMLRFQMESAASTAANGVPFFLEIGQNLALQFAADPRLSSSGTQRLEDTLGQTIKEVPFFNQLTVLDSNAQMLATHPAGSFSGAPDMRSRYSRS